MKDNDKTDSAYAVGTQDSHDIDESRQGHTSVLQIKARAAAGNDISYPGPALVAMSGHRPPLSPTSVHMS